MDFKKQVNQYDKIFRENLEVVIPTLIRQFLKIDVAESVELPDDLQQTKERKPDALKKITDTNGEIFILHLEFQLADDNSMVYRMMEYYAMLRRAYQLPIKQFVIYLGGKKATMPYSYKSESMRFSYKLLNFSTFDAQVFLNSTKPEEILLAFLANFGAEAPEKVVEKIIQRIDETAKGNLAFNKYLQQLRILINLRKLKSGNALNFDKIMDSLLNVINQEEDVLYKRGVERGATEKEISFIKNLFSKTSFTKQEIADLVGVDLKLVEQIVTQ